MISTDPIITRIVIRRNQSLSWQGLGLFLAGGFALTLAIGLLAGIAAGWWPVAAYEGGVFTLFSLVLGGLTAIRAKGIGKGCEGMVSVAAGRRRV